MVGGTFTGGTYGKTFADAGYSLGGNLFTNFGAAPTGSTAPTGPTSTPVTPTFDPKFEANALYGKPMSLFAGGFARIGASPAPIVGPYLNDGKCSFIVSFGVAVPVDGDRKIYAIYLDNELAWSSVSGGTLPAHGTFTAEAFDFIFKPGTLTQTLCSLETTKYPGDENAYRPQMLLQILDLPFARFMENTGKPVPYVACDIGDVTDGADPADGINVGEGWQRIAYSPWAGYTSSTAEYQGITDVAPGYLLKDNFTVVDLGQSDARVYRNIDLVQSSKIYLKDRGNNVSPDIVFSRDTIIGGDSPITITRTDGSGIPRELELLTVDPDQDYTVVPSISKRPRAPFAVSVAAGKQTITLPIIMDAETRQAMVAFAHTADEVARKKIAFQSMFFGYETEPADLIGLDFDVDGIDNEIFKVTQTEHGANGVVAIEAEAILRCSLFAGEGSDTYFPYTILLLSGEGADASTTFTDQSASLRGNASVAGNAQVDTAQFKFGAASILLDGTGDCLFWNNAQDALDFQFGSAPFTIEMFIRPTSVTGTRFLLAQWEGAGTLSWVLYLNGASLAWNTSTTGTDNNSDMDGGVVVINTWQHVAIDFDGTTYRLYLDGAVVDTFATARALFASTQQPTLGANSGQNNFFFAGHIDEPRVTRNVARYAGAFTVPAAAYPRF